MLECDNSDDITSSLHVISYGIDDDNIKAFQIVVRTPSGMLSASYVSCNKQIAELKQQARAASTI